VSIDAADLGRLRRTSDPDEVRAIVRAGGRISFATLQRAPRSSLSWPGPRAPTPSYPAA
jgi:hypothetical protein